MSSSERLDQFYTPRDTARELLALEPNLGEVRTIIDPACGAGSLLLSARERWPNARARGFDIDENVVARLKSDHTGLDLTTGSVYPTVKVSRKWMDRAEHDLVVMNPPYTMERRRYVNVDLGDVNFRSGLAMAHVAAAITHLRPRLGVLAVMPESAFHSELDASIRDFLSATMRMVIGKNIPNHVFRGARARSVLCGWFQRSEGTANEPMTIQRWTNTEALQVPPRILVRLNRGNLPVFRAKKHRNGLRFLHSTDLAGVAHDHDIPAFRVASLGGGQTSGIVVLLSRVGSPKREHVILVRLREEVQLSDCVIALEARTWEDARVVRRVIHDNWHSFSELYRGTGAPFVTMTRLTSWLQGMGIGVGENYAQ